MPVAHKHSTILEESRFYGTIDEDLTPIPSQVERSIFDEILELAAKKEKYEKEEKEFKRKNEKLDVFIKTGQESIIKAEERKEHLVKKINQLQEFIEAKQQTINEAIKYWNDYGIDVKQISKDDDPFVHYEFILTYLDNNLKTQQNPEEFNSANRNTKSLYSFGIKYQDQKLLIVSQVPELLTPDELDQINSKLTEACVKSGGSEVDYRSVVVLIKKAVIKRHSIS